LSEPAYTAAELCEILFRSFLLIFDVWQEENAEITQKRYQLFSAGAKRYLERAGTARFSG